MPFYEDQEDMEENMGNPSNPSNPGIVAPWDRNPGVANAGTQGVVNSVPNGMNIPGNVPGMNVQNSAPTGTENSPVTTPAPKKVDTRELEYRKAMEEYEAKCSQHKENLERASDALEEALEQYEDGKEQMRRQQYDWEKQWKDHLKSLKANIANLKKVKFEAPKKPN